MLRILQVGFNNLVYNCFFMLGFQSRFVLNNRSYFKEIFGIVYSSVEWQNGIFFVFSFFIREFIVLLKSVNEFEVFEDWEVEVRDCGFFVVCVFGLFICWIRLSFFFFLIWSQEVKGMFGLVFCGALAVFLAFFRCFVIVL